MSIASEITRIGTLRDTIRNKLISAGIISNNSAKLDECTTAIDGMTVNSKVSKILDTSTTSVSIPKGYHKEAGDVSIITQEKTQTVTSGTVTVTPDDKKVLKKVTVNGPKSYAGTTQFAGTITQDAENTYFGVPNAGYYNTESKIAAKNSNLKVYFMHGSKSGCIANVDNYIDINFSIMPNYARRKKEEFIAGLGGVTTQGQSTVDISVYSYNPTNGILTLKVKPYNYAADVAVFAVCIKPTS